MCAGSESEGMERTKVGLDIGVVGVEYHCFAPPVEFDGKGALASVLTLIRSKARGASAAESEQLR
jgi:hypothetical protein